MKACMILLLMAFFPYQSLALEKQNLRLYNAKSKSYENKTMVKIGKNWVSESCQKNRQCQALEILNAKRTEEKNDSGFFGNPASTYCLTLGGMVRILKDTKGAESDYCLFKDGTMIDSWNLYYAHHEEH